MELEHPPVRDTLADQRQQPVVVDMAEEVADVGLEDEVPSSGERHPEGFQGVGGRALRSETEAGGQEVGLEDGLEDDLGCRLAHPVAHGGDAQGPHPAIGFWDLHPPHGRRAVGACTEVTGQLVEHAPDPVVLHRLQGQAIDPGGATIGSDPPPRLPQHVRSVDSVEQGVEPATRRLLGRSP
jgi:hypothetical protein